MNIDLSHTSPSIDAAKQFLAKPEKRMLINNEWLNAVSGKQFTTQDPATGEVLASLPRAAVEDVN